MYWGTPKIIKRLTAQQSLITYTNRTEIQENSTKRMIAHGALKVNYGTKKIWGPDRIHKKKVGEFDKKIAKVVKRNNKIENNILEQSKRISDSIAKGHGELLQKRQAKLEEQKRQKEVLEKKIEVLKKQKEALGEQGQRADRDFRKQLIMTFRTLWTENVLKDFCTLLTQGMKEPIDTDTLLKLFFFRRAMIVETDHDIYYKFDCESLSQKYKVILKNVIDGLNRLSLTSQGKRIIAQLVGFT